MSNTAKRPTIKDDAVRVIDRINALVTDDLWDELNCFARSHGAAEIAELNMSLRDEVDLLLLKVFRSFHSGNGLLLLRSAPEAVRLATLTRLNIAVLKLREIAQGTEKIPSRSSAILFFYLFSDVPDNLQYAFARYLTDDTSQ